MVRYTGRAKTQTGMNTNQVGLKMSGCPSRVGRKGTIIRKFNQRVNCMEGLCGGAKLNGKMWRTTYRNKEPFCKKRSTKCAQAAGGVGRINAPYFNRKVRAGESGCAPAPASLVTTTTTTTTTTTLFVTMLNGNSAAISPSTALVDGSILNTLSIGDGIILMKFDDFATAPQFIDVKIEYQGHIQTLGIETKLPGDSNYQIEFDALYDPWSAGDNATLTFTY
tara:strand:- start:3287 stop:3952 length:666 start_codon:yes stop_codon:yes gene_type:complete